MKPKYIDAERLKLCFHELEPWELEGFKNGNAFDTIIDMQPAADVRENIRGHWTSDISDFPFMETTIIYLCSVCNGLQPFPSPFCPICGAEMEYCKELQERKD